jgi:hypothetical protein
LHRRARSPRSPTPNPLAQPSGRALKVEATNIRSPKGFTRIAAIKSQWHAPPAQIP